MKEYFPDFASNLEDEVVFHGDDIDRIHDHLAQEASQHTGPIEYNLPKRKITKHNKFRD